MNDRSIRRMPANYHQWLRFTVIGVVFGLAIYSAWQRPRDLAPLGTPTKSSPEETLPTAPAKQSDPLGNTVVAQQAIRDQDGKVVFRGDVELAPTLARISRQERLRFSNDGSVFQNRERRLPSRPAGYYQEFVHPTPGLSGPGPQRIVVGREGETYYTPDHYRTFKRLDE